MSTLDTMQGDYTSIARCTVRLGLEAYESSRKVRNVSRQILALIKERIINQNMEKSPKMFHPARIIQYFHCRECYSGEEGRQQTSGNLAVGWTLEGLQVFCETCKQSVCDIDFRGQKMKLL